ncbi:MAG: tRNA (adenosine(37)-N6)-threonylcarbamoyltransferase complex ATPase subunit type 1 TsaE [Hydrogenothermaceae bacterium]|nr:tRNA (adenosine(37)-N6)-threonylcarbamoyltransferase complex ATPase subunit type 1 TsaE [Hydrogenothermaceae bacterium]
MAKEFFIKDLNELDNFARDLTESLKGDEIILLNGDLGAGKTTFTKILLKHLGVSEDVISPTFTIMNNFSGKFDIYHIDMYRLDGFDISDIVGKGLIVIEWPKGDEFKNYGVPVYKIDIEVSDDGSRIFRIDKIA